MLAPMPPIFKSGSSLNNVWGLQSKSGSFITKSQNPQNMGHFSPAASKILREETVYALNVLV